MADPHPWPGHAHGVLETCIDCGGPMFMCHTLETGFHVPGWEGCQLFGTTASHDAGMTGRQHRSIDSMTPEQLEMQVAALRARQNGPRISLHYYVGTRRTRTCAALMLVAGALSAASIAASMRDGRISWTYLVVAALHAAVAIIWAIRLPKVPRHGDVEIDPAVFGATNPIAFALATLLLFAVFPVGFPAIRYGPVWIVAGVIVLTLLFGLWQFLAPQVVAREDSAA